MDFSEKWGTDVETAVKLALDDLKLTRDEVDVTVLEEPSRGFFGIGSKLALVRVEKKKPLVAEVKKEEKVDDVNAFEVGNDVTEALKQPKSETKKTEDLADNILSEDDGIYEDVYFDGEEEVNIEDLEEYIK